MKRIKFVFSILILLFLIILTGCINQGSPIYVDSVSVYENGTLLTGTYKYYDGQEWIEYDDIRNTKEKIYYSVDVEEQNIKVVFNVYAPNTTLNELRLLTNTDLNYSNNHTVFIGDDITQEGNVYSCSYEFDFTHDFNAITATGFATSNGLMYMGAKDKDSHFVLWGIHLNYIDHSY